MAQNPSIFSQNNENSNPAVIQVILMIVGVALAVGAYLLPVFLPRIDLKDYIYIPYGISVLFLAISGLSLVSGHIRKYLSDYASFAYLFLYLAIFFLTHHTRYEVHFTIILVICHVLFAVSFKNFTEYAILGFASLSLIMLSLSLHSRTNVNPYLFMSLLTVLTIGGGVRVLLREPGLQRAENNFQMASDLLSDAYQAIFLLDLNAKEVLLVNQLGNHYWKQVAVDTQLDGEKLFNMLGIDRNFIVRRFANAPLNLSERGVCKVLSFKEVEWTFDLYIRKIRSPQGEVLMVRLRDITEQKSRENLLRQNLSIYDSLLRGIPDVLIRLGEDGVVNSIRTVQRGTGTLIGEAYLNRHFMEFARNHISTAHQKELIQFFEEGKIRGGLSEMELEVMWEHKQHHVELRLVPLPGTQNEMLAIVRNISNAKQTELALKQSEANYREMFNASRDAIILADIEQFIPLDANSHAKSLLGIPNGKVPQQPLTTWCEPIHHEKLTKNLKAALAGQEATTTCRFLQQNGHSKWVDISLQKVSIGGQDRIMAILRDIEEQMANRQQVELYSDLFESLEVGMIIMRLNHKNKKESFSLIMSNASAKKLLYKENEELKGRYIHEIFGQSLASEIGSLMLEALTEQKIVVKDGLRFVSDLQQSQYWHLKFTPIHREYVGMLFEIVTDRIETTANLQYRSLLIDNVSDAIISTNKDFLIESWNHAAEVIYGWEEAEVKNQSIRELLKGIYVNDTRETVRKTIFENGFWEGEVIHESKDGGKLTILSSASVLQADPKLEPVIVFLNRDISRQKERERFVRKNEKKFRDLFNSSPTAILVEDLSGNVIDANAAACRLYKTTLDELTKLHHEELVPKDHLETERAKYQSLVQGKEPIVSTVGLNRAGEIIPLEMRVGRIQLDGKPALLLHLTDISERQQKEAALRLSEQKYRTLVEKMDEGLILTDLEENTLFVNDRMAQMLGWEKSEMLGKKTYEFFGGPENKALLLEKLAFRKQGISDQYEIKADRPDDTPLWLLVTGAPYTDSEGEVIGAIAIVTDISDRKHTELKLKDANRELDAFVYKASHDLKGPLASIIGLTNIAKEEVKEPKAIEYFDLISKSTHRLDSILLELIDVTRINKATLESKRILLFDFVRDIINSLKHKANSNPIDFRIQISETQELHSDPKLLTSILQNLVLNSINYHNLNQEDPFVAIKAKPKLNGVEIEIEDNGQGINETQQAKVFEMFYRGNSSSEGSGLGLYIVKNSIEKLKGKFEMNSWEGEGTRFIIYLPNL